MPDPRHARADRNFVLAFFLALVCFYGVFATTKYAGAEGLRDNDGILFGRDFVVFWTASVLLLDGQIAQVFDLPSFHAAQERLLAHLLGNCRGDRSTQQHCGEDYF